MLTFKYLKNCVRKRKFEFFCKVIARFLFRIYFFIRESLYLWFFLYWKYPKLLLFDVKKFFYSLWNNPYSFLQQFPQASLFIDGNVYGETPWSVLSKISTCFGVHSQHTILDLGSGLGKPSFWFAYVIHARCVIGIDNQQSFLNFASNVHKSLLATPALFLKSSFETADLKQASYVYFYGSSYSLKVLQNVLKTLSQLPRGAVVISISFPLSLLKGGGDLFDVSHSCSVTSPWGKTFAYKNVRL